MVFNISYYSLSSAILGDCRAEWYSPLGLNPSVAIAHELLQSGLDVVRRELAEIGRGRIARKRRDRVCLVVARASAIVLVVGVVLVDPGLGAVGPERDAHVAAERQADRHTYLHLGVEYAERGEHDHGYEEPGPGAQVQQQRLAALGRGGRQQPRLDPVHVRGHQTDAGQNFSLDVHHAKNSVQTTTAIRL